MTNSGQRFHIALDEDFPWLYADNRKLDDTGSWPDQEGFNDFPDSERQKILTGCQSRHLAAIRGRQCGQRGVGEARA